MELKDKVNSSPHICGIELDFSGELAPSYTNDFLKFYNSYENGNVFQETYFGKKTVRLKESSFHSREGYGFNQSLSIKFPSNDLNRALRIEMFKKVKFIKIKLSNGTDMVLGRNDYFQNKKPNVKIESDEKMTQIRFSTKSMASLGFLPSEGGAVGFPVDIPIDFINYG